MIFRVFKNELSDYEKTLKENGFDEISAFFTGSFYGDKNRRVDVQIKSKISSKAIQVIEDLATVKDDKLIVSDCRTAREVMKNPDSKIIKSLSGFVLAFEAFVKKDMIDGWLYKINYSEDFLPHLVRSCTHNPANPAMQTKASVTIELLYSEPSGGNQRTTITLDREDIYNKSLVQILSTLNFFKESHELKSTYLKNLEIFDEYSPCVGEQFIGLNKGISGDGYHTKTVSIKGHKLVNDQNFDDDQSIQQTTRVPFFSKYSTAFDFSEEEEEDLSIDDDAYDEVTIPFHPYIKVFNLKTHKSYLVISSNIEKYTYDKSIHNKLVLPEDHRDLIDVLVNDADVVLEDIVSGKSGGTTILCKGEAGLGKTLTAEVYSEIVEKPVYSVHSGQLGTNPDDIDKRLENILDRAERWGAILLLDEADVYIRKRDNSMQHNAIVAAFLRKIERFEGIMFLTTNRSDDVDPAIVSRCIAIIDYEYPDKESLTRIWKVLSDNYSIKMSDNLLNELCGKFPKISGRDVKELLKLASKFISQKQSNVDLDLFRKCAMFRGIK